MQNLLGLLKLILVFNLMIKRKKKTKNTTQFEKFKCLIENCKNICIYKQCKLPLNSLKSSNGKS